MKLTECEVDGVKYVAMDSPPIYGCDGCVAAPDDGYNAILCQALNEQNGHCEMSVFPPQNNWSIIWIKKEPQ